MKPQKSLKMLQIEINRTFLASKNKPALFKMLNSYLKRLLDYSVDYIMTFLSMLSDQMPLHAAVAAEYFQQHNCFTDEVTDFMRELRKNCEKNFILESALSDSNTSRCADLYTTFSYLTTGHIDSAIPDAVNKLSNAQRKALFYEIGNCIRNVHDLSKKEQDLLDPLLQFFQQNYSEEINRCFLKQNETNFSDILPSDNVLTELLIGAIKNRHFSYFRTLYALFPGWPENKQHEGITVQYLIELSVKYADTSAHMLDILHVSLLLALATEGNNSSVRSRLDMWRKNVYSMIKDESVLEAVDFLYTAHQFNAVPEQIHDIVSSMKYFTPNPLFTSVLPGYYLPIGCCYVQNAIEVIMKQACSVLPEFLEKIENINLYRFDKEGELYNADNPDYLDYDELICKAIQVLEAKEVVVIYFNTHIKMLLSFTSFAKMFMRHLGETAFFKAVKDYVFTIKLFIPENSDYVSFSTKQFKLNEEGEKVSFIGEPGQLFCVSRPGLPEIEYTIAEELELRIMINGLHFIENLDDIMFHVKFLLNDDEKLRIENGSKAMTQRFRENLIDFLKKTATSGNVDYKLLNIVTDSLRQVTADEEILNELLYTIEAVKDSGFQLSKMLLYIMCNIQYPEDASELNAILIRIWEKIKSIGAAECINLLRFSPLKNLVDITDCAIMLNNNLRDGHWFLRTAYDEEYGEEYMLPLSGKVYIKENGTAEFVPNDVICKKSKILVFSDPNADYSFVDDKSSIDTVRKEREIIDLHKLDLYEPFKTHVFFKEFNKHPEICAISESLENNSDTYSDGLECSVWVYAYIEEKNCFLSMLRDIRGILHNNAEKRNEQQKHLERQIYRILEDACTDETAITDPPQELFSTLDYINPYPDDNISISSSLFSLIDETITDRLKKNKPELIQLYFNAISHLLHEQIFPRHYFKDNEIRDNIEELVIIVDMAARECEPDLLAEIYRNAESMRLGVQLNKWLALAAKYGKLDEFLNNLQNFVVEGYVNSEDPDNVNNKNHFAPKFYEWYSTSYSQNINIGKFSADGCEGSMILGRKGCFKTIYRIIGYDSSSDTVFLTVLSSKQDKDISYYSF